MVIIWLHHVLSAVILSSSAASSIGHVGEVLELQGNVTLSSAQKGAYLISSLFQVVYYIYPPRRKLKLCEINLNDCPPTPIPPPIQDKICYCTSVTGEVYNLNITYTAIEYYSQKEVILLLESNNDKPALEITIGTFPKISVNGNWAIWTNWDKCSVNCSGGTHSRSRTCTDPEPKNGGANCSGNASDSESCNDDPCPVDGNWAIWTNWDTCSVNCSGGTHNRSRTCTDPKPEHGGANCSGNASESESCNDDPCPVDGNWTIWTSWDICSANCSGGTHNRSRTCTNPRPKHGGANCSGDASDSESCNDDPCPGDGNWATWTSWDTCSVTCNGGIHNRSRTCTDPAPDQGGASCTGNASESESCNDDPCPVSKHEEGLSNVWIYVLIGAGALLFIVSVVSICYVMKRIKNKRKARQESELKEIDSKSRETKVDNSVYITPEMKQEKKKSKSASYGFLNYFHVKSKSQQIEEKKPDDDDDDDKNDDHVDDKNNGDDVGDDHDDDEEIAKKKSSFLAKSSMKLSSQSID